MLSNVSSVSTLSRVSSATFGRYASVKQNFGEGDYTTQPVQDPATQLYRQHEMGQVGLGQFIAQSLSLPGETLRLEGVNNPESWPGNSIRQMTRFVFPCKDLGSRPIRLKHYYRWPWRLQSDPNRARPQLVCRHSAT